MGNSNVPVMLFPFSVGSRCLVTSKVPTSSCVSYHPLSTVLLGNAPQMCFTTSMIRDFFRKNISSSIIQCNWHVLDSFHDKCMNVFCCCKLCVAQNISHCTFCTLLAGLPGFARDSCSIIMSICAFHFYIIYFHFFSADHGIPQTFDYILTPKPPQHAPWCIEGLIVFSLCPFRDESADVYQIWCQSVQPFGRFSRLLHF